MKPFKQCPVCETDLSERIVEKILKGGNNTAVVRIPADVCLHCGERLYSKETVKKFEAIRSKLDREDTDVFQPIGQTFKVQV